MAIEGSIITMVVISILALTQVDRPYREILIKGWMVTQPPRLQI